MFLRAVKEVIGESPYFGEESTCVDALGVPSSIAPQKVAPLRGKRAIAPTGAESVL